MRRWVTRSVSGGGIMGKADSKRGAAGQSPTHVVMPAQAGIHVCSDQPRRRPSSRQRWTPAFAGVTIIGCQGLAGTRLRPRCSTMTDAAIAIDHLDKVYAGGKQALSDVSFEVPGG